MDIIINIVKVLELGYFYVFFNMEQGNIYQVGILHSSKKP